ncbi:hypothetical protein FEV53_18505 [Palleronia caenipelagi]|uniref:Uncharacterized protein n=1 Tax=Palleronia caenipelagi TaxID=2489174 RepID=A0A547PKK9_9RHOB|nr:hypothetical protein FEV53_18505 [Palleronia caenipelagi]
MTGLIGGDVLQVKAHVNVQTNADLGAAALLRSAASKCNFDDGFFGGWCDQIFKNANKLNGI